MVKKGMPIKDLSGQVFGDFQVDKYLGDSKWLCKCVKCGYEATKRNGTLYKWKNYCPECKSIIGKVFGDLKILSRADVGNKYKYFYECECIHCGHKITKDRSAIVDKVNKCEACNSTYGVRSAPVIKYDLTNQVIDDLTVTKCMGSQNKCIMWECLCKCTRICYKNTAYLRNKKKYHTCPKCAMMIQGLKRRKEKVVSLQEGDLDLLKSLQDKGEVFKPIEGFEDYQIGTFGDIFSYKSGVPCIITQTLDSQSRYYIVSLCRDGKTYHRLVHILVAKAFIPNPDNLPEVNHKNTNEKDNVASNLEWCTQAYNVIWSYQTLPPDRNRRRCRLYFPNGEQMEFDSYADVVRYRREHNLDFSESSLTYHGKSRGFRLEKLEKASNKNRKGWSLEEVQRYLERDINE